MRLQDAAQAEVLIRALCVLRDKMIGQVNWLEKYGSPLDAAALRRDINEAQAHITGLQHRYYLGRAVQASQPVRRPGKTFRAAPTLLRGAVRSPAATAAREATCGRS